MIWVCLPVIITVLKASVIIFANEDNVFETDIGDKIQFDSNSNNLPLLIFQQAFFGPFLKQTQIKTFDMKMISFTVTLCNLFDIPYLFFTSYL